MLDCLPIPSAMPLSYDIHSQGSQPNKQQHTQKYCNYFFLSLKSKLKEIWSLEISYWIISWLTYILMLMEWLVTSMCQLKLTLSWEQLNVGNLGTSHWWFPYCRWSVIWESATWRVFTRKEARNSCDSPRECLTGLRPANPIYSLKQ